MKHNTKKGFTLVELLVVIAILAILATVSVVGYTSFIEGASLQVDEDLATQLNHFLLAYKVNNNDKITEDNIWEVTQEILDLGGIEYLDAQTDDYYFFYDLEEGEYIVKKGKEVDSSWLTKAMIYVGAVDDVKGNTPGNLINNRYFLVDTKGSDLANVIRGFYTLKDFGAEDDSAAKKFGAFVTALNSLDGSYKTAYLALANESVFATSEGSFVLANVPHSQLFIHDEATFIGNSKLVVNANGETLDVISLDAETPMLTVKENTTLQIPGDLLVPTYSLNVKAADGKTVKIEILANSWKEVEKNFDAEFTSNEVTVILNGATYVVEDTIVNTTALKGNSDIEKAAALLASNFPVYDFNLIINAVTDKVVNTLNEEGNSANSGYVALDIAGGINFNFIDLNKSNGKPASKPNVEWDVVSLVVNGVPVTNVSDYITFNGKNISFVTDANGVLPKVDKIVVKATSKTPYGTETVEGEEIPQYASQTYTVEVVRVTGVDFTLSKGTIVDSLTDKVATLVCDNAPTTQFNLNSVVTYSHDLSKIGIKLDASVVLEYVCDHICNQM